MGNGSVGKVQGEIFKKKVTLSGAANDLGLNSIDMAAKAARLARGLRNNNPGNIEYKKGNDWKGKLPYDPKIEPRFERFRSMEYGARALLANLRTYFKRGNNTIEKILNTWAPSSENLTLA